jgi:hypothetical protein
MEYRYRQLTLNIPQSLYIQIKKAQGEAREALLGVGEDNEGKFLETLLRLGAADIQKIIGDTKLVQPAGGWISTQASTEKSYRSLVQ